MQRKQYDETYGLINFITGETERIEEFGNAGWGRVFKNELGKFLMTAGDSRSRIQGYLVLKKEYNNLIINASLREIAEGTNCSTKTVQRVLDALIKKDFIRRVQRGTLMMSPYLMQPGAENAVFAAKSRWNKLGESK